MVREMSTENFGISKGNPVLNEILVSLVEHNACRRAQPIAQVYDADNPISTHRVGPTKYTQQVIYIYNC